MIRAIFFITLLALLAGCRRACVSHEVAKGADMTAELRARADSAAAQMSVRELAGQVIMPATYTVADAPTMARLRHYITDEKVCGLVFLKGDTASMRAIADTLQRLSRFPLFMAVDAETGLAMRLEGGCGHPPFSRLRSATEQQMYDYGNALGLECSRLGLNMVLGPVLDVAPAGSVMERRSLGPDARRVADLGNAYARGLEDARVLSVAKHFPGHGATATDSHRALPVLCADSARLRARDLLPFREYVRLGFPCVMAGHIAAPALTGDTLPAVLSAALLTGILRGEMGFKGLIITDAVNMEALRGLTPGEPEAVVASLVAGADIILAPEQTQQAVNAVMEAVHSGRLPLATLRARVSNILFYKYLLLTDGRP